MSHVPQHHPAPHFFKTPSAFRKWLAANHDKAKELFVGFYKKGSGKPSITWPESVDEALCFGWIDGVRKTIDDESYMIRFSPRKPESIWSAVNIRNVERLSKEKRMQPAGLKAFAARKENRSGIYAYEQRPGRTRRAIRVTIPTKQSRVEILSSSTALLSQDSDVVDRQREAGRDATEATRKADRNFGKRKKDDMTHAQSHPWPG